MIITDEYESLGGNSLIRHFNLADEALWCALSIVAQAQPRYLQRRILIPVLRQATGMNHGRKWFVRGNSPQALGRLVEITRGWVQEKFYWSDVLKEIQDLGFYRDTVRGWVEDAKIYDPCYRRRVLGYLTTYLAIREEITNAYLPLVWKAAASYGFTADVREDLFQIGSTGLLHAVERYNNVGPVTFSTFAGRWIRQAILMYISRRMPVIRVSHSVLEVFSKINREELASGKKDLSDRAQRIRSVSGVKDVLLVADPEAEQHVDEKQIDLAELPRELRQVLILKYGLLDHARSNATQEVLDAEHKRQESTRQGE